MRALLLRMLVMLCATATIALAPSSAGTEPLSAAHVVALGKNSDGSVVEFEGEAVGEALRAGDGRVWVNVSSGGAAVGVVASEQDAGAIDTFGRYGWVGSTVYVRGVLNVACDEHGGDLDVHATDLTVVQRGHRRMHAVPWWQLGVAGALLVAAALAVVARRRLRHRFEVGGR